MSGPDYWQQQQLEQERQQTLISIIRKARMARKDGYFTDEDIEDMQREFGLSTRKHTPKLESF